MTWRKSRIWQSGRYVSKSEGRSVANLSLKISWSTRCSEWNRSSSRIRWNVAFNFGSHDLGPDQAIVSRFLPREEAHHRAFIVALAGRAEPAFHQRRHEPVRANFSWSTETVVESAARGRYPKMHSGRRQTQRSRRRRSRHLPSHFFRNARQLELRRLLQKGSYRMGVGTRGRTLEISSATALRHCLQTRTGRTKRIRSGSA